MDGRFTDEELAIAKSVDLCAVAESLGYTVKRIGNASIFRFYAYDVMCISAINQSIEFYFLVILTFPQACLKTPGGFSAILFFEDTTME